MEDREVELRARLRALEGVVLAFLAHAAAQTNDPMGHAGLVMEQAQALLVAGAKSVLEPHEQPAAAASLTAFGEFGAQLMAHMRLRVSATGP